jgi:hypothetical protein
MWASAASPSSTRQTSALSVSVISGLTSLAARAFLKSSASKVRSPLDRRIPSRIVSTVPSQLADTWRPAALPPVAFKPGEVLSDILFEPTITVMAGSVTFLSHAFTPKKGPDLVSENQNRTTVGFCPKCTTLQRQNSTHQACRSP